MITPTAVAPDSPESYNGVADRLAREIPGAWRPNQFANLANPEIHYRTTGPEIWEQTEGRITAFVAGVGTGGTISGVGRYLKERNPAIKIIGADPEGSVLSGEPRAVEGRRNRRGFRAQDVQRPGGGRMGPDRRRRVVPHGPGAGPPRGDAGGRFQRYGRGRGARYARRLGAEDIVVVTLPRHRPELPEQILSTTTGWPRTILVAEPAAPDDRRPAADPRAADRW